MPIRTNRGRAAVYRKLWGWPLRSPRHLVVAGLFLLAIILFIAYIVPRLTGGSQSAQPPATTTSSKPGSTPRSPTPTQGAPGVVPPAAQGGSQPSQTLTETRQPVSENKTPAKADPSALDAALKWAEAFTNHPDNVKPEDWLNQLKAYTTDEYFGATLSKVDPKSVAQSRVRGGPVPTADSYTSSVTVDIPTDVKKLRLTLVKTDDGWRVNEHTEVD
ncbi:hypothetical protein [Kibdelosporangium phytohabitans]|uniref:Uncharacterized protein n=1 Tax=Kibdelosporangium phytohabitans TaxID=860235 RepID=A0A0N9HL41_9PSEU|nr:hypothetical protein [Kibdelosporangium phytohabitans]ALG06782.1 hypothetical protein AOZ06_07460 [Kibdelosporangium phytohabitans]MBE1468021.1 cytoskeletal protein RodZ [Kibdelosporangium phytohabitans]